MSNRSTQVSRFDRGAAAVEFAVVSSLILIPLLLGIIEFGFIFQAQIALTNAAREGARMASVGRYDEATVAARAFPVIPDDITPSPNPPSAAESGDPITITVTYEWQPRVLPFLENVVHLKGEATMRRE